MSNYLPSKDEQTILEIEKETFEAIKHKDAVGLQRILDDRFVYRSPHAPEAGKAEFIKAATSLPVKLLSVWGENLQVNIYGQVAVLTGVQHAKVQTDDGKEAISSVAFTDIFVKRLHGWAMILAFGVELGATTTQSTTEEQ
ncbi:MAG TPA: nuclear transport factor 2 family protein [Pyrinomonadaceae bacterium]|nr:nuclear transport factor 2 family protein [Pyrinomonadaceae bacterium]